VVLRGSGFGGSGGVSVSAAFGVVMVTGPNAALMQCLLMGLKMQTILEILLVNTKTGNSKKTGQPFSISEAHCVLRDESGKAGAVGVLTVPKGMEARAVPGIYTASFAIEAPTYGDNQGKVIAVLKDLIPLAPAKG
jgi:hypothetical protein